MSRDHPVPRRHDSYLEAYRHGVKAGRCSRLISRQAPVPSVYVERQAQAWRNGYSEGLKG
jgi:hypothetical protein